MTTPVLTVDRLSVDFAVRGRRRLRAVRNVSLAIQPGEIYGLVGESGSGKTTIGRAVLGLIKPTEGTIRLNGEVLSHRRTRADRRTVQVVFQDPLSSLNPRRSVGSILAELVTRFDSADGSGRSAVDRAVSELLGRVGLDAGFASRRPGELSGGQRQRVAIARALAPRPEMIVCDEALSALDMSTRETILDVLAELRQDTGVALLFIAHDLPVVHRLADRIGVLYLGELVEEGDADRIAVDPQHPYTQTLFAASPVPDPRRQAERRALRRRLGLAGEPPSPLDPPPGCGFHPRCPQAVDRCRRDQPERHPYDGGQTSCHLLDVATTSPTRSTP